MTNKYPATCRFCKLPVAPGRGWMVGGKPGTPWDVVHPACVPVSRHSVERGK